MLHYTLTLLLVLSQLSKACTSYCNFSKVCEQKLFKKIKKKYKENKMNFEDAYLSDGSVDSAPIWNRRCPTPRECLQQNWLISVQALWSNNCVKTTFS